MLKNISILVSLTFFVTKLFALTNLEVAQKVDRVMSGYKDLTSDIKMILINAQNDKRVRTMRVKSLELKNGDKSIMKFLSPADVKGTKFLNYEHDNRDNDQWIYLPAIKRVKRIASKNSSSSFMGSEFAYEDLNNFNVHKYKYEGNSKEVTLNGKKVYKIVSKPVSKNSRYKKLYSYISKKDFLIQKIEYFDSKKKIFKRALFSDYKKILGFWRIGKINMKNINSDKQSILIWSNQKLNQGLSKKDFHKRVLKK